MKVAIGLRAHSGWAAAVAIGQGPVLVHRSRLEIKDPGMPVQGYHAAKSLPLEEAEALIRDSEERAAALAERGLRWILEDLQKAGHDAAAAGVVLGNFPPAKTVEKALSSHAGMHAAEGHLYREALIAACNACGLTVTGVRDKELASRGAPYQKAIAELGKLAGPPWTADQKSASIVALLALDG
jgi:hypothetical protein